MLPPAGDIRYNDQNPIQQVEVRQKKSCFRRFWAGTNFCEANTFAELLMIYARCAGVIDLMCWNVSVCRSTLLSRVWDSTVKPEQIRRAGCVSCSCLINVFPCWKGNDNLYFSWRGDRVPNRSTLAGPSSAPPVCFVLCYSGQNFHLFVWLCRLFFRKEMQQILRLRSFFSSTSPKKKSCRVSRWLANCHWFHKPAFFIRRTQSFCANCH